GLMPMVRSRLREVVAGYLETPLLGEEIDAYLVPPALGERAGVLGAIRLARRTEHAPSRGRTPPPPRGAARGPRSRTRRSPRACDGRSRAGHPGPGRSS